MSRIPVVFAVAFLTACAGCVGGSAGTGASASQSGSIPVSAGQVEFDDSTGAITGHVVSDEVEPVPGAQVGLVDDANYSTVSDQNGVFVLNHVPPGKHNVAANALGFEAAARSIDVVAGQATGADFTLTRLPVAVPWPEAKIWKGYIDCAFAVVRTTLAAGCGLHAPTNSTQELFPKGFPADWKGTMVEASWNSQTNPDWLAFDYNDRTVPNSYFGVYARYRGTSPVHFLIERCGDYRSTMYGRVPVPCDDENVTKSHMHVETFYDGKFQEQTHAADVVCQQNISNPTNPGASPVLAGYQAGCYGVGPAVELVWTNYITIFHLELPANVATYSLRPDG